MNETGFKDRYITYALLVFSITACLLCGYVVYNQRATDAEYRAINARIEKIDRDIKSEFGNLNRTIVASRKEAGEIRVITSTVRESLEGDRATRRELSNRVGELEDTLREVRKTAKETGTGK